MKYAVMLALVLLCPTPSLEGERELQQTLRTLFDSAREEKSWTKVSALSSLIDFAVPLTRERFEEELLRAGPHFELSVTRRVTVKQALMELSSSVQSATIGAEIDGSVRWKLEAGNSDHRFVVYITDEDELVFRETIYVLDKDARGRIWSSLTLGFNPTE